MTRFILLNNKSSVFDISLITIFTTKILFISLFSNIKRICRCKCRQTRARVLWSLRPRSLSAKGLRAADATHKACFAMALKMFQRAKQPPAVSASLRWPLHFASRSAQNHRHHLGIFGNLELGSAPRRNGLRSALCTAARLCSHRLKLCSKVLQPISRHRHRRAPTVRGHC